MSYETRVDALYELFCSALPAEIRSVARELAHRLKLVPASGIPWSAVFKHAVTLGAPVLLVADTNTLDPEIVDRAVLAHMLSIIEAFGTDRIADRQTADVPELRAVLERMRDARDRALFEIGGSEATALAAAADRRTMESIEAECRVFQCGAPVAFAAYETVSAGKQAVGLPSTVTLARRAGFSEHEVETARATLMGIWLGLQMQDDVVDWEDDWARGGAWAVALARNEGAQIADDPRAIRKTVLASGVLARMLEGSARYFRRAREGAEMLESRELIPWLLDRETEANEYVLRERKSPGYLQRLKKLSPWMHEVLG